MTKFVLAAATALTVAFTGESEAATDPVPFGETTVVKFDIIDARIGSRDADIRSSASYTAPTGYVIVGVNLHRDGHHSSVSAGQLTQPGNISYRVGALGEMSALVRDGFAKGVFSIGDDEASGDIALDYAKFWNSFSANFSFIADTHASVQLNYVLDSKSFDHGAKLDAHAMITLKRQPTEDDIENVIEVLTFVIEQNIHTDVTGLIEQMMAVEAPS